MIRGSKKIWRTWAIAMAWFYVLLWPLMGIHPDGTLTFRNSLTVWAWVTGVSGVLLALHQLNKTGKFDAVALPLISARASVSRGIDTVPIWIWWMIGFGATFALPFFTGRYVQDVAINVMIYICLGLGLNIVVGLCGLLDLGFIAFYGVGAYTYGLLSIHYAMPFWICLPFAALTAAVAGCIIGYPTLRMRGDYLAIVTLGFGEIVRLILNNWMQLTNGPNGILGIQSPGMYYFSFADGFTLEHLWLKKLTYMYYIIMGLMVLIIIAVQRLNFSRIGRAWEAIREDETVAELMGVNTFKLKLSAYAMGAVFGGLAGAFFAARMRFVSPESFTFLESAMVLAMVVLGGMGSIPGIMLGALALVALPEVFREFELYRMLAFGGAMTVMMIFKPRGLWPAKRFGTRSDDND
ncbi:MAG: branched-chain amino acid ABC transporter permease [Proteobacteria bacterium]|nr:branched-chain amino acid ABC transporter permease [Pseudomonadota bacterium]